MLTPSRGVDEEIGRGLMDAVVIGRWYFLPKVYLAAKAAGNKSDMHSKVAINCNVLETLAVDVLKEVQTCLKSWQTSFNGPILFV
jgi:hypothetical protein